MWYNISEIRQTDRRLALKIHFEMTESFGRGGHFFFVILQTSAIIDTISESNKNNSSYVTISTALLSKRAKSALRKKRANRPPFKVRLIPTTLYHYSLAFASIIKAIYFNEKKNKNIFQMPCQT